MSDFIKWLDSEAPDWIVIAFIIAGTTLTMAALFLSLVALVKGYWIVPLLLWIVLPAYIVIRAYLKDRNND